MLRVGKRAPDFELECTLGTGRERRRVSLEDYDDEWLVLVFYPRDFSLVCPTELTALSNRVGEFSERHCRLLGISTDDIETHERWIATPRAQGGLGGLEFPLASDIGGSVASAYGVYQKRQGICQRGLFIIDPNGVLQFMVVNNMSVGRRADDVLHVLAALDSGGMCPEDWRPNTAPMDPVDALRPGNMFASYRIEGEVGAGSFGSVFRARDTTLDRTVALKVFRSEMAQRWESVLQEARAAAALHHPNVCAVYAVDSSEGAPGIAMEFIDGPTLRDVMEGGPVEPERATELARQMALGLAAAHAAGVAHGDLKPANVMVTNAGIVKITDFGLATKKSAAVSRMEESDPSAETVRAIDASNPDSEATVAVTDEPSLIAGTPAYMAPEVTRGGGATAAADTFAFGVILREILTGQRLFVSDNPLRTFALITSLDPAEAAAELPDRFAPLVEAALAPDPQARPTMAEVAAHLE
jgi:alkyl hydroperoxide reductase subunit AhpC